MQTVSEHPVERRWPAWRSIRAAFWVQVSILAFVIAVLYGAVLLDMARDWYEQPSLSQGMLIVPLALYLAWLKRERILAVPAIQERSGLLLIAVASVLFLLGRLGAEFFLARISFVVLIAGLIWTFWGRRRLRALGFPLLILATMVPLPVLVYNTITGPLQLFASSVGSSVAQSLGVSVYRDGNIIRLATISLGVEEACSGLNSLAALVVGALLLGYLHCSRWWSRTALVILAVPLSIGANVLRIAGTAVIADQHRELAMGFYHSFSGWLVFLGGFALLYGSSKALHILLDSRA